MILLSRRGTPAPTSRVGGFAAIGFALSITLSNAVLVPAGLPPTGSPTDEVTQFFATEGTSVALGSLLTPTAWLLAALFGAGVVSALRHGSRARSEVWSLFGFAGLVLQNGAFAAIVAIRLALASVALPAGAPATALWAVHDALFTLNGTFLAMALIGLSTAGTRAGLIARWHGALGLLSAALMFSSATLTPLVIDGRGPLGLLGLVGWLLWVVWTTAYGVALLRAPNPPQPDRPASPGPSAADAVPGAV
ncbi:2-oxoglutarate/malate transporter [Streptomyces sp. NPDC058171]